MDLLRKERSVKDWLFFYSVVIVLATGAYLTAFFFLYLNLEHADYEQFRQAYNSLLIYIAGFGTVLYAPMILLLQYHKKHIKTPLWQRVLERNFYLTLLFLVLLYVLYLAAKFGIIIRLLDLTTAILAGYLVYRFQNRLVTYGYNAWQNVFTPVTLIIGMAKAGLVFLFLQVDAGGLMVYVFILLIIEFITIILRFQVLKRHSFESRQTGRVLLMRHHILFSMRIILGIFIPLVYALYYWFGKIEQARFIVIFFLVGELMERYLFIHSAVPSDYVS